MPIPPSIAAYCNDHNYTEPFWCQGQWWAFPPGGVMPIPLQTRFPGTAQLQIDVSSGDSQAFIQTLERLNEGMLRACQVPAQTLNNVAHAINRMGVSAAEFNHAIRQLVQVRHQTINVQELLRRLPELTRACEVRPDDPLQAAIWKLETRFRMDRAIARLRVLEFCDREQLDLETFYQLLSQGNVAVKFGSLHRGKGFLKARKRKNDYLQN